jgi:hypothetical protein
MCIACDNVEQSDKVIKFIRESPKPVYATGKTDFLFTLVIIDSTGKAIDCMNTTEKLDGVINYYEMRKELIFLREK